ncbi:hypothetical protein Lal_00021813 [Lupinus albus]|uniref:Small ribosomal subunit protein uS15c n=1 Tax=Lupinus albus TaxID=3870 RepID=A0A6A4NB66_LUPAL|nr:putative ribosomal protein S15 [Lupinus albus]KAF1865812.1 hypothetical protein Lal_00021813 [Lupinus albus]
MSLFLHHRATTKFKPSLLHRLFSSSGDQPPSDSNSPFSSTFRDIKQTLKQQKPSSSSSLQEIQRNLSEFRRRTSATPSNSGQISFQELYKRNIAQNPDDSLSSPPTASGVGNLDLNSAKPNRGKVSFDAIRESLRQIKADGKGTDRMSLPAYRDVLKSRPSSSSSKVFGGTSELPESVFGPELRGRLRKDESSVAAAMRTEFVKVYGVDVLGEKLRKLRPEKKERDWFSIKELNERLIKLREIEEKESLSTVEGVSYIDLRESLIRMKESDKDNAKKNSVQRMEILNQIGGTPEYLMGPPKEHLVEKYFHPDNMSSAEKLKIELTKVRDEFKMSESDCGSARVQVALLTTKIKHLSAVLHKKDVHSRKGLIAMVQRRKKLLKYLRRTDWDSYCLVISKLNLRDNPEHTYRGRSTQAA